MRFLIHTPPYVNASAGIRTLHRLCHLLRLYGQEAYVTTPEGNPDWLTPYASALPEPMIHVVGETMEAPAGRVVRYCLNFPGLLKDLYSGENGPASFAGELVIFSDLSFWDACGEALPEEEALLLTERNCIKLSVIEPEIFYCDPFKERPVNAVYLGKGEDTIATGSILPDITEADLPLVRITRQWPASRKDLAELLRSVRTLYSFDGASALLEEALICGCKVNVWTNLGWEQLWDAPHAKKYQIKYYDVGPAKQLVDLCKERWNL